MKWQPITIMLIALAWAPTGAVAGVADSEDLLQEFDWPQLKTADQLESGRVVPSDGVMPFEALEVTGAAGKLTTTTVLTIEAPSITRQQYVVRGQVKYEDVKGKAYLEMWSHFPDGSYFSRTLSAAGPTGTLEGASGWRPFILPFSATGSSQRPTKLVINVVLPAEGKVWLGPLELFENGPAIQVQSQTPPLATAGQWWTDRQAGLIGGIGGAVIGCFGGLLGTLAGLGKARRVVLGGIIALFVVGNISLIIAVVALACSQPRAVYYPLLLLGLILGVVNGCMIPTVRKRYQQVELRKMLAMDT